MSDLSKRALLKAFGELIEEKPFNKITITDKDGFTMSFLVEADYTGKVDFEVTDIGTMTLHIGANKDQNMIVSIPDLSTENLYIDEIDVTTADGDLYDVVEEYVADLKEIIF